jgi:hypothetical protein
MDTRRIAPAVALAAALLAATLATAQDVASRWTLTPDGSGRYSSAVYRDPAAIAAQVTIKVGDDGSALSGAIHMANGFERPATDGELRVYWGAYGGVEALWNALQAAGKLEAVTPGDVPVPTAFVGPEVRAICTSGNHYTGKIVSTHEGPNWFVLDIDGHPLTIFTSALTSLQRIRSL